MEQWILALTVLAIGAGWLWVMSHPLLRSLRTVGILGFATIALFVAAAFLPLLLVLVIAGLVGAVVTHLLMNRADLVGALDPPTYRFVMALVDTDNSGVELQRLERAGEISRDERIRRMRSLVEELSAIPEPSEGWDGLRRRKIQEILAAIELLAGGELHTKDVAFVQQLRAANAREFRELRNASFNFWR